MNENLAKAHLLSFARQGDRQAGTLLQLPVARKKRRQQDKPIRDSINMRNN
jgi:hypothetical protein